MSEEEIDNLSPDELSRLFELYRLECKRNGITPRLSEFHIWLEER